VFCAIVFKLIINKDIKSVFFMSKIAFLGC
jgi:hypothetical protein